MISLCKAHDNDKLHWTDVYVKYLNLKLEKREMRVVVSKKAFIRTYKSIDSAYNSLRKNNQVLPLIASPDLARIAGFLITDGFVDVRKYYHSFKFSYVGYFSRYKTELDAFGKLISTIFHVKGKITRWGVRKTGRSFGFIVTNNFVTRVLSLCQVPCGRKTSIEYPIPSWIKNGSLDIKRAFLQASFDSEGSIHFSTSRKRWEIKYTMYKISSLQDNCVSYLSQLKEMLDEFGIDSSNPFRNGSYMRKDGHNVQGFMIRIEKKVSVKNYRNEIGFRSKKKRERLAKAVNEPAVI